MALAMIKKEFQAYFTLHRHIIILIQVLQNSVMKKMQSYFTLHGHIIILIQILQNSITIFFFFK